MKTTHIWNQRFGVVKQWGTSCLATLFLLISATVSAAWELSVDVQPFSVAGSVKINNVSTNLVSGLLITSTNRVTATANPNYAFDSWVAPFGDPFEYVGAGSSSTTTSIRITSTNGNDVALYAMFVSTIPNYTLTVIKGPGGLSTSPTGTTTYAGVTDKTISAIPSNTPPNNVFAFDQWTGDIGGVANVSSNSTTIHIDASKVITATFVHLWTISQTHFSGPADLATIVSTVRDGTTTNLLPASILTGGGGGQRYRCNGWSSGTGSIIPASSTGPDATHITVNVNAVSSLDWNWIRQYQVTTTSNSSGYITLQELSPDNDANDGWVDTNTSVRVTVNVFDPTKWEPDYVSVNGVRFDLSPTYQVDVLVTNPVSIVPFFRPSSQDDPGFIAYMKQFGLLAGSPGQHTYDDPDNDGLSNIQEYRLSNTNKSWYYNPINPDTDGDGMDDAYETFNIDPTNLTDQARANLHPAATDNGSDVYNNGPQGNPDGDYHWDTTTGFMTPQPLVNIEEYRGPDGIPPWTNIAINFGDPPYVDVNGSNQGQHRQFEL